MRVPGRSRARAAAVTCEEATESISARLDGERHPLAEPALAQHLAGCPACRDFEADAVAIGRRALLRAPRPVPGDLMASLVPLLEPSPTGLLATKRHRRRERPPSFGWTSTARWAGVLVPAITAVAAISLGLGSHPHLVPTRPPSPCTAGLVARHLRSGG
jgi:predicted anti-sigma-YlaC factor YlaD